MACYGSDDFILSLVIYTFIFIHATQHVLLHHHEITYKMDR
jgi:hypothetical protein